ncbi:metal-dependent hydrolase family protein [Microtetraspora fusca]|uniref:metal-dependent hydrolase family protein n=1 Tax=Microtetraspora fusca TaxID=1997 RepID=UPI000831FBC0|nr:amidohydrolase family protein [Microtetraspora fusca]
MISGTEQTSVLITNARVLDVHTGEYLEGASVLVADGVIVELGGSEVRALAGSTVIDAEGRTVLPGFTDAHVHVTACTADLAAQAEWSPTYVAARAGHILRDMLHRGFTTVRDMGGADYGLADAVDDGFFTGPRLLFGGKALSQTGGHADMRHRGRIVADEHPHCPAVGVVCDGVDHVRKTAREQLRTGAHHIKLMLSGGVASPTDRVDSTQLSLDEIRAAVEEAEAANRYVAGHAYTARAINRALRCGVRSIEHGNLLDETSIELFKQHKAFYVPTLVTYRTLADEGPRYGLPADSHRKVSDVLEHGLRALELAHRGGVQIAFGTDLLGGMHPHQAEEFAIRAEVQPAIDVIRSATCVAARLVGLEGRIGEITPGAYADILMVEGDPLDDITVLARPDKHLKLVMKAGHVMTRSTLGVVRGS